MKAILQFIVGLHHMTWFLSMACMHFVMRYNKR